MPDISKITLPNGTTYDIKDAVARGAQAGGVHYIGKSTTVITDGGTETPTINGSSVTPSTGDMVIYEATGQSPKEFVWDGSSWSEFGDMSSLGALAYKSSATGSVTATGSVSQPTFTGSSTTFTGNFTPSGSVTISTGTGTANYTPAGTVSTPTISVNTAGATTAIKNPTSTNKVSSVDTGTPSATALTNQITYATVTGETLSLYRIGYTTGATITTSNVTVKTGDATYTASQPTFTGTGVELKGSFSGTQGSVSVSGTPNGSVSQPTFSGNSVNVTVS